jgi:hypothetical protein
VLEIHPLQTAIEAVVAFETRVHQAQQVGQDVGLLQGARRNALILALATIETELAPWRESDPSGYESALMMARANAEQVSRTRREAMASNESTESETPLVETSTLEVSASVASNESTESETPLVETSTPEVSASVASNESTESETPLVETSTLEVSASVASNESTESETPLVETSTLEVSASVASNESTESETP